MPKHGGKPGQVGTIKLDQTDPKIGDTITFTTTGGQKISVGAYPLGVERWAAEGPVGTAFVLGDGPMDAWRTANVEALTYAWLDGDDDLSNGHLAAISWTTLPA